MPSPSSAYFVKPAKSAMFGWTRLRISGASTPVCVPGLASTNNWKFRTKFGSANLLSPERKNSIPRAAWINADAARAVLPLAGRRRIVTVGAADPARRCMVFIPIFMPIAGSLRT